MRKLFLLVVGVTLLPLGPSASATPQIVYPSSDVETSGWTSTPLWEKIDDLGNDGDLVTSSFSTAALDFTVGLPALTDPQSSAGHVLRVRVKKASGTGVQDAALELLQSSTVVDSITLTNVTSSFTEQSLTLDEAAADSITDYSALRVRVTKLSGSKTSMAVSGIQFEVPESAPAPTIESFSPQVGVAGDEVMITGLDLTGASEVEFDSIGSSFTVDSDTQITAVVPSGLTEGESIAISVTTPGGSDATGAEFTVAYLAPAPLPDDADNTSALNAFLAALPDGSVAVFPASTVYKVEGDLTLSDVSNLTVQGRDAELHRSALVGHTSTPPPKGAWHPQLTISEAGAVTISDLIISSVGSGTYNPVYEEEHGIKVGSHVSGLDLLNVVVDHPGADGISLASEATDPRIDDVLVSGGQVIAAGRSGLTVLGAGATNVVFENVSVQAARSGLDMEMTRPDGLIENLTVDSVAFDADLNMIAGGGDGIHRNVDILNSTAMGTLEGKYGSPNGGINQAIVATATGGTYTASMAGNQTSAIAFDASAASVRSAFESLPDSVVGEVNDVASTVDSSPHLTFTVTFQNGLGLSDRTQLTADGSGLESGHQTVTVATTQQGDATHNEIQTVELTDDPTSGSFTLTFEGQTTGPIAVSEGASLNALNNAVVRALYRLSNVESVDIVDVSAGPIEAGRHTWMTRFGGQYANQVIPVPIIAVDGSNLTGPDPGVTAPYGRFDITFDSNVASTSISGSSAVLIFAKCDGVVVTNNEQPGATEANKTAFIDCSEDYLDEGNTWNEETP